MKDITLVKLFEGAEHYDNLMQTIERYQTNGVRYFLSYGFKDISTEDLIRVVIREGKETKDLQEIHRAVNFYIHSY